VHRNHAPVRLDKHDLAFGAQDSHYFAQSNQWIAYVLQESVSPDRIKAIVTKRNTFCCAKYKVKVTEFRRTLPI
jgi:hypothetical protein